jgi:hypothetical protein
LRFVNDKLPVFEISYVTLFGSAHVDLRK